jgi:hypothetical protein
VKQNRQLKAATYLVVFLLIVVPLLEVVLSVWPLRWGQTNWRFGTVGVLSQALITPLLGVVLVVAAAYYLEQRRLLNTISLLAGLAGLFLLVALVLFPLDALEMRARVRPESKSAFDASSALALFKLSSILVVCVLLAIGCRKAARGLAKQPRR